MAHVLVAGVGNIFLGDDGFGVAVARRLASLPLPPEVRAADFGIRGIHLAYELLDEAYSDVILIDAVSRGGQPGTLWILDLQSGDPGTRAPEIPNAHGMNPDTVLALVRSIVPHPPRIWLVGCEPAQLDEEMGLSEPVGRAVDEALGLVQSLVAKLCRDPPPRSTLASERRDHA